MVSSTHNCESFKLIHQAILFCNAFTAATLCVLNAFSNKQKKIALLWPNILYRTNAFKIPSKTLVLWPKTHSHKTLICLRASGAQTFLKNDICRLKWGSDEWWIKISEKCCKQSLNCWKQCCRYEIKNGLNSIHEFHWAFISPDICHGVLKNCPDKWAPENFTFLIVLVFYPLLLPTIPVGP